MRVSHLTFLFRLQGSGNCFHDNGMRTVLATYPAFRFIWSIHAMANFLKTERTIPLFYYLKVVVEKLTVLNLNERLRKISVNAGASFCILCADQQVLNIWDQRSGHSSLIFVYKLNLSKRVRHREEHYYRREDRPVRSDC